MLRLLDIQDRCYCCKSNLNTYIKKLRFFDISCVRRKCYYRTLGLDSTATAKDIKNAYYDLSVKHHPDKNKGSQESIEKFKEITEAYEVLGNPEKKKLYDENFFYSQNLNKYSNTGKFYRSSSSGRTYTGRTKDFNYNEHYKRHYEDFQKQREMEYEYFKRRWEADFFRRYPTAEEYYRNRHRDKEYSREDFSKRLKQARYSMYFFFATWIVILCSTMFYDFLNPERTFSVKPKKVYYKVEEDIGKTGNE